VPSKRSTADASFIIHQTLYLPPTTKVRISNSSIDDVVGHLATTPTPIGERFLLIVRISERQRRKSGWDSKLAGHVGNWNRFARGTVQEYPQGIAIRSNKTTSHKITLPRPSLLEPARLSLSLLFAPSSFEKTPSSSTHRTAARPPSTLATIFYIVSPHKPLLRWRWWLYLLLLISPLWMTCSSIGAHHA